VKRFLIRHFLCTSVVANAFEIMLTKEWKQYLTLTALTWIGVNLLLNLVGLVIGELLEPSTFGIDIFWFAERLFVQFAGFTLTFILSIALTRRRVLSLYAFSLMQFMVFHVIFFADLTSDENGYYFISQMDSWSVWYLMANHQELIDIVSYFYPTSGTFEDGMFIPELTTFYSVWIAMTLVYFVVITWLTGMVVNFIRNRFALATTTGM